MTRELIIRWVSFVGGRAKGISKAGNQDHDQAQQQSRRQVVVVFLAKPRIKELATEGGYTPKSFSVNNFSR